MLVHRIMQTAFAQYIGQLNPPAACHRETVADTAAAMCDVFLSVGTAAAVYPAAGLAATASSSGATVIEINLAATELTARADIALSGPAGEVLPRLLQALDRG